ncbi:hypothetical protein [Yoonia sp. 2307UL14-13]|uniref:hypothetical protein n=1 Tax=Yoonia sp. 2307UL14-13 TaxID=3126506 RepID=UPI0030B74B15
MTISLDIWLLLGGAFAGAVAVAVARGRNRIAKGAIIGAVIVFLLDIARSLL